MDRRVGALERRLGAIEELLSQLQTREEGGGSCRGRREDALGPQVPPLPTAALAAPMTMGSATISQRVGGKCDLWGSPDL